MEALLTSCGVVNIYIGLGSKEQGDKRISAIPFPGIIFTVGGKTSLSPRQTIL
jgi:hypothetical protein